MKKQHFEISYVRETVFTQKIDGIHKEIDGIHEEIGGIHNEIDGIHKDIRILDKKIDDSTTSLNKKIDNVALELVKHNDRFERIENTMATKSDINMILDRLDHGFKKMSIFDQEETVQSLHLQEVRRRVDNHEKRIKMLESCR